MKYSYIGLFLFIIQFSYLHAKDINDSLFHQADIVVSGHISKVLGSVIDDLGTEIFHVQVILDTIIKQNTHVNFPDLTINWEVSSSSYKESHLQGYIDQFIGKNLIFLLNQNHINGSSSQLDSLHIIELNEQNFLQAKKLAEKERIVINFYEKQASCRENCKFCKMADKEKWNKLKRYIKRQKKGVDFNKHRSVKYVLPMGEILASLPSWGTIYVCFNNQQGETVKALNYQLGYIFNFYCLYHYENIDALILLSMTDGAQYEIQKLEAIRSGLIWQANYDTAKYPEIIPMQIPKTEYVRLFEINEDYKYFVSTARIVEQYSKEYIDSLESNKYIYNLCMLSMHRSLDVKTWAVQALARLNDPRAIPYLIDLAEFYKDVYLNESVLETKYQLYLREIVAALDLLTSCSTVIPYGTDFEQFRLSLGLPVWKSKIKVE